MSQHERLARPALDTLPINIAILDETGEILFTNRAWRDFASAEAADEADFSGRNYLATTEDVEDVYARRAGEGIQGVIAGDRELFTMEYPCHSPNQKRWFLMRVTRFTTGDDLRVVVAHVDITDRKLAEITAAERADELTVERNRLAHVLERVNGLITDVAQVLVGARTRSAIESGVCERFAATDPYVFAWIGRPDLRDRVLQPKAWAGSDVPESFGERELPLPSAAEATDPTARAFATGDRQVVPDLRNRPSLFHWDDLPFDPGSVAAIPLAYRSKQYGVLTVYAEHPDAFDDREQVVLDALGQTVANAINAVTTDQIIATNSVIELTVSTADPSLFPCALTAGTDASVTYNDSMYDDDGVPLVYVTVSGLEPDGVEERVAGLDGVEDVRVLTAHEDDCLLEVREPDSLVSTLADYGGVVQSLTASGGQLDLTVDLPDESAARSTFEYLEGEYEGVELRGYREQNRSTGTKHDFQETLESELADRQLTALRTAYFSGFFEWPRPLSGDEVAESMEITRATFHQHLREAERKLAAAFFER